MMRLAWRDIRKHWGRSIAAVLLFALPIVLVTSFFSMMFTAIRWEEHPTNTITKVRTLEDPGPGFSPLEQNMATFENGKVKAENWLTALEPRVATKDLHIPPAGTVDLPLTTARALGVKEGDRVVVAGRGLTVNDVIHYPQAIANYADFREGLNPNDHGKWWVVLDKPPAEYVTIDVAQPLPTNSGPFLKAFFRSIGGAVFIGSFVAVLVIVSAGMTAPLFAVAHSRMSRTVELLSQVGARHGFIRRVFAAEGLLLGLGATLVGLPFSWLLADAVMRFITGQPVRWDWILGLTTSGLAILSAVVSSQIPLLFTGHKKQRTWLTFPGPLLLALGAFLMSMPKSNPFLPLPLIALGGAMCGWTVVALLPVVAKLLAPVPSMALRDAHRNHLRSSGAIGAIILATIAVALLGLFAGTTAPKDEAFVAGTQARTTGIVNSPAGFEEQLQQLESEYGTRVDVYAPVDGTTDSYDGQLAWYPLDVFTYELVAEPEILDFITLDDATREAARAQLLAGNAVTEKELGLPNPGKLITPAMARDRNLYYKGSLFPGEPGMVQTIELHRMSQTSGLEIAPVSDGPVFMLVAVVLTVLSIAFVAAVLGLIVALTQQESRRQHEQLEAVGAGRRTLRRYRLYQVLDVAVPGVCIGMAIVLGFSLLPL
ncbi:FtsX-like permease family protein [Corynebacterium sp. H130]|uniref:FtsX-like permease family protein n=1 Tax=Corynebacterium sp. H130 TaxID=3133444 RepID=UPI0030B4F9FA